MNPPPLRVAALAWEFARHDDWSGYAARLDRWIARAAADLVLFPEYAGMEAALVGPPPAEDTPTAWCAAAAALASRVLALHVDLARGHGCHLLTGSLPVATAGGFVNRAWLVAPDGTALPVDKQIPTPWERAHTPLVPGAPLAPCPAAFGPVAALICHDAEFPPLARAVAGPLLLVPACTDTPHGAARVRLAARARALEGGRFTALAQTVGQVPGCAMLDVNHGRAGIYAPPNIGQPPDGILDETAPDRPDIARAILRLDRRPVGEVDIAADWPAAEAAARRAGPSDGI